METTRRFGPKKRWKKQKMRGSEGTLLEKCGKKSLKEGKREKGEKRENRRTKEGREGWEIQRALPVIPRPHLHEKGPCSNRLGKNKKKCGIRKNATEHHHHHCPKLSENATNHSKNDKLMSKIRKISQTLSKHDTLMSKIDQKRVVYFRKVSGSKN